MDEAKRMEEGLNSPMNGDGKDEIKKQESIKSIGGDAIEHSKDAMAEPVGESVQQTAQQGQPLVKQRTKRVATLDAFRGLTIAVSVLQTFFLSKFCA